MSLALVTGASRGIGREIALALANAGHHVIAVSRTPNKVALNQFTRHLAAEISGSGVTANVIHPGDVRTEMWADIAEKAVALGEDGADYKSWVDWVEKTGGDDPTKAADLVMKLISEESAHINGQFLWIDNPLQPPVASWDKPVDSPPWL
jgi:NAD(P)-dependent dehydrogenase (short-subunit alcohol dehydrogenase family)